MASTSGDMLGASRSLVDDEFDWPIHGLRHPPTDTTSGWFVWTGELSDDDGFFLPWHTAHLVERHPDLAPLLEMPPGTRFLIAPDHRDVWDDPALLDV